MPVVLAVGLDRGCLDVLAAAAAEAAVRYEPVVTVVCPDARAAREWLAECGEAPHVIIAAFHEHDAWGLSALFTRASSLAVGNEPEVVLVSHLPVAALPVLITDVRALRTVAAGSATELQTHLDRTFSRWSVVAVR